MKLKEFLELKRSKGAFAKGYKPTEAQLLGLLIAKHFEWDGQDIFDTMKYAFEEANFHSFNKDMEFVWEQQQ